MKATRNSQQLSKELIAYTSKFTEIPTDVPGFELSHSLRSYSLANYPSGEEAALNILTTFIESRVSDYSSKRNFPAVNATSKLSPYLASGVISARQCLQFVMSRNSNQLDKGNQGCVSWISELCWVLSIQFQFLNLD